MTGTRGKAPSDDSTRLELADRYQDTIDVQVTSLKNFDDKTWRTIRATGIIAGASIGGLSLLTQGQNDLTTLGAPTQISLTLATILFISSFAFGIRSYQSSQFSIPPWVEIGRRIHGNNIDRSEYSDSVLKSYADAIDKNRSTLKKKRNRFRHTLLALLFALCNVAIACILIVWNLEFRSGIGVVVGGQLVGIILCLLVFYTRTTPDSSSDSS